MQNRTYRYYKGQALYPFGYGLSYGRCAILSLEADRECATLRLRNESDRVLEEVVELYVRDEGSPLAPPFPVLCGFGRVRLAAGEETSLRLALDPAAFTVVDETGKRIGGSGRWTLYAGFGAPDARTEELTGRKAVSVSVG